MARLSWFVALMLMLAFSVAAAEAADKAAPRRSTVMSGLAGHQPYFYQGTAGQQWAARHSVGFRQIPFQVRIVGGHRHVVCSPYYFRYYPYYGNYNYNYNFNYRYYPASSYSVYSTGGYEPSRVERRVVVAQPAPVELPPEPVTDGWALLGSGDLAQAVGQFALDVSKGDKLANVGYAIASGLRGEHGQAVWAMRKAVSELGAGFASAPAEVKGRITTLIAQYEIQARTRKSADVYFMLAALRFVEGDAAGAKAWLAKAVDAGDDSTSAKALGAAIEKK